MAKPWSEAAPASDQNTLATIAVNGASTNVHQIINEGGEKIIQRLADLGRIFMVPDAERFSHKLEKKIEEEIRKQDSQVPDPFKEWDEA